MKKLFSLAGLSVALIALLTVGCEKPLDEAIIGKWEVDFQKTQAWSGGTMIDEEIDTMDTEEMVIEILKDGTGNTYEFGDLADTFTWVLDEDMMTVTIAGETPMVMEFKTTIKKDKLTLVWTITEGKSKAEIDMYKMIIIAHRY